MLQFRKNQLTGWRRTMRFVIALSAAAISMSYAAVLLSHPFVEYPLSPECFRSVLLVMLSAGLAVEISNTPPRL